MRRSQGNVARKEWYDRSPTSIIKTYESAGVAPHVGTERWTYTVPAAKKFMMSNLLVHTYRDGAPASSGRIQDSVYTTNTIAIIETMLAAVGDNKQTITSPQAPFLAGEVIAASTLDQSTGGTVIHRVTMIGMEFNA